LYQTMPMQENPELALALNFIEKTDRNVFLTGKAGTGKTTFLHQIKAESLKRLVVVAPTGVAAINAKGVTIHSFFQMPFGPIVPNAAPQQGAFQQKFSKTKIDIIKSLDLVVIDEISMVRADLLDGIDQVLRKYKNRDKVFGGAQVLMIGDVQQLSPVVKPNDWELLRAHYNSVYFFSSHAFQQANAVCIELKHIYRQDNQDFITILNEIRNNCLSPKSIAALNTRYQPDFTGTKDDGYITLTTHNHRAEAMNNIALEKLQSKTRTYTAKVTGKFNEFSFPTAQKLVLKVGAQVLFIKNDSSHEKRYYNGKIGVVTALDATRVTVQCPNEAPIVTTVETWENIRYTLDSDTQEISEDMAGSFAQIPLRLAWAITIHKSQGLTFEKAIIDAEASFAHGQTYVALSRCTSLEGMVLKTPIKDHSIITDTTVHSFTEHAEAQSPTEETLQASSKTYQLNLLEELFDFRPLLHPVNRLIDIYYTHATSFKGTVIEPLLEVKDTGVLPLLKIGVGFKNQLALACVDIPSPENSDLVQERFQKALIYFKEQVAEHVQKPLETLTFSTENKKANKEFGKHLKTFENLLTVKTYCFNRLDSGFNTKTYASLRAAAVLQEPVEKTARKKSISKNEALFDELQKFRHEIAENEDIPLTQVFSQHTCYEICEFLPKTTKELLAIAGMGKLRVEKYGKILLDLVCTFLENNEVTWVEEEVKKPTKKSKVPTKEVTFQLFKEGFSAVEISKKRGLALGTIQTHLTHFVATGAIDIASLIAKGKLLSLQKDLKKIPFDSLSEFISKTNDAYSYAEIRMALKAIEHQKKQP